MSNESFPKSFTAAKIFELAKTSEQFILVNKNTYLKWHKKMLSKRTIMQYHRFSLLYHYIYLREISRSLLCSVVITKTSQYFKCKNHTQYFREQSIGTKTQISN